jgi:hypothetical protein
MSDIEVYRITPEVGKYYEHAEYTRREGRYPNERYYAKQPKYVGKFIRCEEGGYRDNHWRTDYFRDAEGMEHVVPYTYEGTTAFREVQPHQPKTLNQDVAAEIQTFVPPQPPSLREMLELRITTLDMQDWRIRMSS